MTTDLNLLVDRATSVLRRRFQDLVCLDQPVVVKDDTRSVVLRCGAVWSSEDSKPVDSVIIKYMRDDPARGFTEWASLDFLSGLPEACEPVPRFLGGDIEHRLVILEDLGGSSSMEVVLRLNSAETAESTLLSMATSMARLQAGTVGKESSFAVVRGALPEGGRRTEAENWLKSWDQIVGWFQALDCPMSAGLKGCAQDIAGLYADQVWATMPTRRVRLREQAIRR